jgi:hypothetical protein
MAQVLTAVCGAVAGVAVVAVVMVSAPFASFGLDAWQRYSFKRVMQKKN